MNEIIFELDETKDRPVINVMSLDALIDTGAEISVCNLSPAVFELITEYKFILAAPLFLQVYYAFDMPNHKMISRY